MPEDPSAPPAPDGEPALVALSTDPPTPPSSNRSLRAYRDRRRAKKALRSKLRRRLTRTGIALVLLIVVVIGGSGIYLDFRLHEIGHLKNINTKPIAKGGADDILLVGSTDRCLVKPAKNFEVWVRQCAEGVNGNNSDVIMILRLVPGRPPALLSVPRDTFVPDARSGGLYNKVDAALANGPNQLIQAIEEDFGIPINHFVVLNFETFTNVVDALGGITMYFPTSLHDEQSGLNISHSGCLHISGAEALALVRARHMQYHYDRKTKTWLGYDGSGDIGRIERDHVFLKVLAAAVAAKGVGNPIVDSNLLSSIAPNLTVDSGFSTTAMLHLILDYHSDAASAPEYTLPIAEDTSTYFYKGYNYGDVVFPTEPLDQQTIDKFMGGKPVGATLSPASITVSVADGGTTVTSTPTIEAELRSLGYKVSDAGSATPVGPVAETSVFYSSPSHLAEAERVLRSLSGAVVLAKGTTLGGADVTVVTGSDVTVAVPGAKTVSAPSGPAVTTATGAASVVASLLSAMASSPALLAAATSPLSPPTSAALALAPYDPRACPKK